MGRALAAYRKLRLSDPKLFESVEVMSQPASNVDSVILSWAIESQAQAFPCSVWQRDCFSSVFGEAAEKAMFLGQQISCLVAEKCTSKIQITDTDFSKQFKALVRQKLQELRSEWKDQPKQDDDIWTVGAKEILTSVAHAQNFMSEKNLSDNWVLKAAVRNGILAYRPNPDTGKLEELLKQPWAQKAELAFGSKRYPGATLEGRLTWKDSEAVPVEPDWNLSATAKNISDLIQWDYWNPEAGDDEQEELLDIDAKVTEDLELELQNSLNLMLHPHLRRAAWHRLGKAEYKVKAAKKKQKQELREQRRKQRTAFRGKMVLARKEKLKSQSRQEVLEQEVPAVKQKAAAKPKKLSAVFKASSKLKASLKDKASQKEKNLKKNALKAVADKTLPAIQAPEDAPPLPAPQSPPPDSGEHPFLGKQVVVASEAAKYLFGREGSASNFSAAKNQYMVTSDAGNFCADPQWLALKASRPGTDPLKWPKYTQLSKRDMLLMLESIGAVPELGCDIEASQHDSVQVFEASQKIVELDTQHIQMGFSVLRWALAKSSLPSNESSGVYFMEPFLTCNLEVAEEGKILSLVECKDFFVSEMQAQLAKPWKLLLIPLHSPGHWTLLVAQRVSADIASGFTWRFYDSLEGGSKKAAERAVRVGSLLDTQFQLPDRQNVICQPDGSNACGFFCCIFLEQELRLFRAEWLKETTLVSWTSWKARLSTMSKKLKAEADAMEASANIQWKNFHKEKKQAEEAAEKAKAKLDKLTNVASQAYAAASEALNKHSQKFTWRNLSKENKAKVVALEFSNGKCSKCRWASGCLACDAWKCLRHCLWEQAAKASKKPYFACFWCVFFK